MSYLRLYIALDVKWVIQRENLDHLSNRSDTVGPLHNEDPGITNDIFQPSNSKMSGKETRYNEPPLQRTHFPSSLDFGLSGFTVHTKIHGYLGHHAEPRRKLYKCCFGFAMIIFLFVKFFIYF